VVNIVDYFTWEYPQVLTIDSEVTLAMEWISNMLCYVAVFGGVGYILYTHVPNDIQSDYFMLGTVEREHILEPYIDLPGTVKFFQFPSAWSNVNIGQVGWHSYLSYPGFKGSGESSWTSVPFVYSVNGTTSWLDNTVNWGGACYDNVNADYTYQHVHFYPTSETTLKPDTLLWSPPICAMKTRTNGYFYIPSVATDLLKIEMLFDDSGLVGDQTGGSSPYSTISRWPSCAVNMLDYQFVKSLVGEHEGTANWDYMADVDGDKAITMLDYQIVKRNLFHIGNYICDFAGVTVVFDTGDEATPDGGYITIPDGARNFNISRNSSPIGAMIIFW
jgi:hypothetical protein